MPQATACISRRALFAATPAIALATAPAVAATNPDAELLTLAAEWRGHMAERERLTAEIGAIDVESLYPPLPPELHWQVGDWFGSTGYSVGKPMTASDVGRWRKALQTHWLMSPEAYERLQARALEIIEAEDAHTQACLAIRASAGWDDLDDRLDALNDRIWEIENRTGELAAVTEDGRRFKAEIVARNREFIGDGHYQTILLSLFSDLGVA